MNYETEIDVIFTFICRVIKGFLTLLNNENKSDRRKRDFHNKST